MNGPKDVIARGGRPGEILDPGAFARERGSRCWQAAENAATSPRGNVLAHPRKAA